MTDKAVIKWPIMQISTLLRVLTHSTLDLRKNLLATAGNLKINEKSVSISISISQFHYLFLDIERKPEYGIIEFLSLRYKSKITP